MTEDEFDKIPAVVSVPELHAMINYGLHLSETNRKDYALSVTLPYDAIKSNKSKKAYPHIHLMVKVEMEYIDLSNSDMLLSDFEADKGNN